MNEQENLELQIKTYDSNYRAGMPICTDEVYDKLVDELIEKFPYSELLRNGVIKQKQKESRKQKLPLPMYSLNKCKSIQEIRQWLKSNNISDDELLVITPKYDGISLVTEESTDKAWTRGDGEVGQISDNHFAKMNDKHCGVDLFAFGEAIMPKDKFEKYKDKYANPRNMVAGLFNRDEPGEELKDVDYIRYGSDQEHLSKMEQLDVLNKLNDTSTPYICTSSNHINDYYLNNLYKKWSEKYNIDGLVLDINRTTLRKSLGREENLNPKYARAIKLPKWSQSAIVKVTGVTWQVSKQGKMKPVIQIEPTELAGITITNVTGYNAAYIFDNDIAEGSEIEITRSGDVIPKHLRTLSHLPSNVNELSDEISFCPYCESQTRWDETITELICTNLECEEQKIMKLVHFFNVLEVEDFGEPSIRKLYRNGFNTIEKILRITMSEFSQIDGFGFKSSENILKQFWKLNSTGVSLAKLLHASDVFDGVIGEKTTQKIFDYLEGDIEKILSDLSLPSPLKFYTEELLKIDGVAEKTAKIFQKGISKFFSSNDIKIKISYIRTQRQEVVGSKWNGAKICFTGCRPTKEQQSEIESQGGEIVSGVSSKTTHLVVKDLSSTSSKMQKAKELGIEILILKDL